MPSSAAWNGLQTFQPRPAAPSASVAGPNMAELNMIMKALQTLVPELPKLDPGDPGTRARRFQHWLLQVTQALEPAGYHVTSWWSWIRASADAAHKILISTPLDHREQVFLIICDGCCSATATSS